MSLQILVEHACNKDNFTSIHAYCDFSKMYLEFIKNNLQAVIVSRNENHYQYFQYKREGTLTGGNGAQRNCRPVERLVRAIF